MAMSTGEPSWKWRRLLIYPTIAACLFELHALRGAADTAVNLHLADLWAVILAVVLCAYTGFATAQDIVSIWRTGSALPYAPPPPPDRGMQ